MTLFPRLSFWAVLCLISWADVSGAELAARADGNRLTYLTDENPFYPRLGSARLTTPQWIGETGVEAVVILAIDDMKQHAKYEAMLRPILERLKEIDGHAPVSIMCNEIDPAQPHLKAWLEEGVSLETHTLAHPCPLLAKADFATAAATYHDCVALLNRVPGPGPVAFRMPCCDSMNSPSPRFYAEIFNRTNSAGQFLTIDSSIMNILSARDPALPRELVVDADGGDKFRKYVPFPSFTTTIENYPYPYVIGKLCWEFPGTVPSDWEAQHLRGTNNPATVADWKAALDATVLKQGVFTFVFHPHGWIRSDQMVEFIDYAVQRHGTKVKFLNFREAGDRLNEHLLGGHSLRSAAGQDNGVRLLDLNNDGYFDVVVGNDRIRSTRLWLPMERRWRETDFPVALVTSERDGATQDAGIVFGIIKEDGFPSVLVNGATKGAWHFDGERWIEAKSLWTGLDLDGRAVFTSRNHAEGGVRLRDINQDGRCELVVGHPDQRAVFSWSPEEESWQQLPYALPAGTAIVDELGRDAGLRFVDINEDGFDDVIFSDERHYSLHLFVPKLFLGFQEGWSREVLSGKRGDPGDIPMIVRAGLERNNGAWFHSRKMWVQNEDTAALPDYVDRRSFDELLAGFQPKAKTPEESMACLRALPGFKVELVASEPLIQDPVAFEWGADGKLWVVEMGDYPTGVDGASKAGGVVRFLEDTDDDGRYDRSTVFLEGLNFPTGVMPWRNGILVSAAPEIFYAEDQDSDGKADLKTPLFRGFGEGNQQHRVNGFEYGLDNWVYGANGDSGGRISTIGTIPGLGLHRLTKAANAVRDLSGRDFRFRPDEGSFETVSGQTQFGRHRDDWGNWFGNNNPAWLWHYVLPEEYLARNPHLPVKSVKQHLANYPDSTRAFAISRSQQRFNDIGMLNHVTSANSPTPYRDELFGSGFDTSVFVSEPVHNLVHREVLESQGVTFTSRRPRDEAESEFLASTDNWFRPVMLKTGPDGALYVADMYRLVLEHPEWIPPDTQRQLDLRAGSDKGRIYRVYPADARLPRIPRLAGLSPRELASSIESPNGWVRDTAQRLLVHAGGDAAVRMLVGLAADARNPKARLQALCTLDGLGALTPAALRSALGDPHPAVRQHAVRLSEPFLRREPGSGSGDENDVVALEEALLEHVTDVAAVVRYQLAFTLGEWLDRRAGVALLHLAINDADEPHIQTAVLSSAVPHTPSMLEALLAEYQTEPPTGLLRQLLELAVVLKQDGAVSAALRKISRPTAEGYSAWQFAAAAGFLDGVERLDASLAASQLRASGTLKQASALLSPVFLAARETAVNPDAPESKRLAAVPLLRRGLANADADFGTLAGLLQPQASSSVKQAALANLRQSNGPEAAVLLLDQWAGFEPALRADALGVLLSRGEWTSRLLDAIEQGRVPAAQISPSDRQKMLKNSRESVRERARALFSVQADRRELLKEYREVLDRKGDRLNGATVFRQNCATCHRAHGEGVHVGPDLGALSNKSPGALLTAILDPNQAAEIRYVNYTAVTRADREVSGIIIEETPSSVTLRGAGGADETILRSELRSLAGSGLSLMPEGFEKIMTPAELADLIAFLTTAE